LGGNYDPQNAHRRRLAIGRSAVLASALARENHVAEAITHTRQAVDAGLEGKADGVVEHGKEALKHAQAAQKEKSNRFVRAGIIHLKQPSSLAKRATPRAASSAKEALANSTTRPH
jgi:hypothetical protein